LLLLVYYPTIRKWSTQFEAMVVAKVDDSVEFSTRKGRVQHADFKEIMLCDATGREFEQTVENAVYDRIALGAFVRKKYMEDGFSIVENIPTAEQVKTVCRIHPHKPKPEKEKKKEEPPPKPAPEKAVVSPAAEQNPAPMPAEKPAEAK
ncbi:MAG: hypothetical protein HY897_00905, partial [Deltaproteobacteria bacterium]|nr:hypothetical protein [Deltaproteobacteria bacterium]